MTSDEKQRWIWDDSLCLQLFRAPFSGLEAKMSQKISKAARQAARRYAAEEEAMIASAQMEQIYHLPFWQRLVYAVGVIFKFGMTGRPKHR